MNVGILIPGFGADENDWALPVYQNFVRELSKTHDVRVITLRYPHTRKPYDYHGAKIYPLGWGAWTKGANRLRLWWDTWQTMKQLHTEKPFDILHGIWADETGALSGWIGKRLNIPSVVTIAGGELVGLPDIQYGLQISRYGRWIVRQAIESNTVVVSPYNYHLTQHLTDTGYKPSRIEYIPLGIDTNIFQPSHYQQKLPKRLVHVGSLIPVKNQKLLLDAMAQLADDITLDIIGEGILEADLKHHAKQLGMSHRVNFLGKIPHTELHTYYSRAQLHIVTSHHEAFCMAILEAGACGTPTIGTNVGLIADEVHHTLSCTTLKKLVACIQSYLDGNNRYWQDTSLNLGDYPFTVDYMAQKYSNLYYGLL